MAKKKDKELRFTIKRKHKFLSIIGIGIILGISIPTSIIFIGHKTLGYNDFGLNLNTWTGEIEQKVYEEGWHWIGIFNEFIIFPSTWQTVEFTNSYYADDSPLSVQSKDGLLIIIELSFQFRIRKADVLRLYENYGIDYRDYILSVARSALRAVCSNYAAMNFYANRSEVNAEMNSALINILNLTVEVGDFQLRGIDFPSSFEEVVEELEIARIELDIAEYARQQAIINAQTMIIEAQAAANVSIIEAQATAEILNITLTAEAAALFNLSQQLGFNQTELLTYLWIQAILEHDESYLIIGVDTPVILGLEEE